MKTFNQYIPTKLLFGCGTVDQLAEISLPGTKALIVISSGTRCVNSAISTKVVAALQKNHVSSIVFDKILPNPTKEHVMEAAEICRRESCDFVVGLGGGSLSTPQIHRHHACNPGDYWDYVCGGTGKGQPTRGGALPVIAIPTTAGTGTEVDPWTVITYNNEKIGFGNQYTFPVLAIVDPTLMTSVPPRLTAYQGFDAFFHAAEGFIANIATPISELYSLKSLQLIYQYVPTAVRDGANLEGPQSGCAGQHLGRDGRIDLELHLGTLDGTRHERPLSEIAARSGLIALSLAYFETFIDTVPERFTQMVQAMTGKPCQDPKEFLLIGRNCNVPAEWTTFASPNGESNLPTCPFSQKRTGNHGRTLPAGSASVNRRRSSEHLSTLLAVVRGRSPLVRNASTSIDSVDLRMDGVEQLQ